MPRHTAIAGICVAVDRPWNARGCYAPVAHDVKKPAADLWDVPAMRAPTGRREGPLGQRQPS